MGRRLVMLVDSVWRGVGRSIDDGSRRETIPVPLPARLKDDSNPTFDQLSGNSEIMSTRCAESPHGALKNSTSVDSSISNIARLLVPTAALVEYGPAARDRSNRSAGMTGATQDERPPDSDCYVGALRG
jgi:hypothetical protein